ncbi:histidine kinase [Spirillospora sp. NPDC047279]|uniref:sensor histidine kinase n=1 Tax=Spirillospora sp. NPDC047279 TaxID=3155478 RepID=UPI0033ED7E0A
MRSDWFRPGSRWLRGLVVAASLAWGLVFYVRDLFDSEPRPALHGEGLLLVVLNVLTIGTLAVGIWAARTARHCERSRRWWTAIGLLPAALAGSLGLYLLSGRQNGGFVFSLIALWVLVTLLPVWWSVGLALVAAVAAGLDSDFGLMAAIGGVGLGALATRQRVQAQEATRRAEANTLVLDERAHIAREIHDILAHSLSAQIVHLEGARLLLSRDGDRVQALDRVERAQRLARAGLEETRRALATLRGDAPRLEEALAELAEEFRDGTGRSCEVEVTGTPHELSPQSGLAVIRTAQEALTNVRKHAPGAQVRLLLAYGDGGVELDVIDTGGTEAALTDLGGGYGLVGMRERAELIGGTLETGPEGEGFRVKLRVPA